jgi:hypothetical protein
MSSKFGKRLSDNFKAGKAAFQIAERCSKAELDDAKRQFSNAVEVVKEYKRWEKEALRTGKDTELLEARKREAFSTYASAMNTMEANSGEFFRSRFMELR